MNPPKGIYDTYEGKPLRFWWTYHDIAGNVIGHVARYDGEDGSKDMIPFFKRNGSGFECGGPPEPRPLFGLDVIAKCTHDDALFILEGEKCATALHSMGLMAVTSQGGGKAAQKADWRPVKDFKEVVLMPDNDSPGEGYMRDVAGMLARLPGARKVFVFRLSDLPEGGDVIDWLQTLYPDWDGFTPLPREAGDDIQDEFLFYALESTELPSDWLADDSEGNGWESPIPLDAANVPPFPSDVFPPPVQQFVNEVSVALEVPLELPAMLTLSVLATACQGKFEVGVKSGYAEPLNLWTCVALQSGGRKSATLSKVSDPVFDWQHEEQERMADEIKRKSSERRSLEAIIEAKRREAARANTVAKRETLIQEIADLETNLPVVPPRPQLIVDDITPENLAVIMQENEERMALFSSEGGIFQILAGRYSRQMPHLDLFLKAHSGDPVSVNRQGREPIHLKAPALSVGIAPQPHVVREMHALPGFRDRGLLARFLFAMPRPNFGQRTHETPPVTQTATIGYHDIVRRMLALSPEKLADGKPMRYELRLSPEAFEAWHAHQLAVETELRPGGIFEHVTDWAGKFPGAIARIAGLLHVAEHANGEPWKHEISSKTMSNALRIGVFLKAHTLIAFHFMGADPAVEHATHILHWVRRERRAEFSHRDCHYALKHRFNKAQDLEQPLQVLVDHHYIRARLADPQYGPGRPRSTIYEVNPDTHEA